MAGIKVEGGRKLRREIKRAGLDIKELKQANRRAAQIPLPLAKTVGPKKTGKLLGNARAGATQRMGYIRAGGKRIPYAGPIHFGWPSRNIKGQPWITKAVEQTEPIWFEVYTSHVNKIIDKINGKGKGK